MIFPRKLNWYGTNPYETVSRPRVSILTFWNMNVVFFNECLAWIFARTCKILCLFLFLMRMIPLTCLRLYIIPPFSVTVLILSILPKEESSIGLKKPLPPSKVEEEEEEEVISESKTQQTWLRKRYPLRIVVDVLRSHSYKCCTLNYFFCRHINMEEAVGINFINPAFTRGALNGGGGGCDR